MIWVFAVRTCTCGIYIELGKSTGCAFAHPLQTAGAFEGQTRTSSRPGQLTRGTRSPYLLHYEITHMQASA